MADMDDNRITTRNIEQNVLSGSNGVQSQVTSTDDSIASGKTDIEDSSARDVDERGETVILVDPAVPFIDEQLAQRQTSERTYACVVCKKKTKLKTFNDNSLKRGDHIQIKGRKPYVGRFYKHHAIISDVSDITEDGKYARVNVIDVSQKAKGYRKNIIANTHVLNKMEQLKCSKLVRLDYRKRPHDKETTLTRAQNSLFSEKYNFLKRNCEHFATACVGGEDTVDDQGINNSISLQSTVWFWRINNCALQIMQLFIYIFSFYIYAVFAAQNDKYNHFPDGLSNWLEKTCQNRGNVLRGFDATCNWVIICIGFVLFSVLIGIMFLRLYFKFYKKNYMCKECLLSTGCMYVFRVVFFIAFYTVNIFIEMWLYHLSLRFHISETTLVIIVVVAIVEGIIIYVLAYYITKLLLYCLGKSLCCSSCCGVEIMEDSYKYAMSHF